MKSVPILLLILLIPTSIFSSEKDKEFNAFKDWYGKYPFDLMKIDSFKKDFYQKVPSSIKDKSWVRKIVLGTPGELIKVNEVQFLKMTFCMPHDCESTSHSIRINSKGEIHSIKKEKEGE